MWATTLVSHVTSIVPSEVSQIRLPGVRAVVAVEVSRGLTPLVRCRSPIIHRWNVMEPSAILFVDTSIRSPVSHALSVTVKSLLLCRSIRETLIIVYRPIRAIESPLGRIKSIRRPFWPVLQMIGWALSMFCVMLRWTIVTPTVTIIPLLMLVTMKRWATLIMSLTLETWGVILKSQHISVLSMVLPIVMISKVHQRRWVTFIKRFIMPMRRLIIWFTSIWK